MFQVIKTGWAQHGQETISSNALLCVSWICRAMDWGHYNWVWDKTPVSQLNLSKFHQDLIPHFIFRPGNGILSWYWNSYFTGTMTRHPHHYNIKYFICTENNWYKGCITLWFDIVCFLNTMFPPKKNNIKWYIIFKIPHTGDTNSLNRCGY